MSAEVLAAHLYDWNNDQRLHTQRADVDFWSNALAGAHSILIVGCGTGRISHALAARVPGQVIGLDLDAGRIAVARRGGADLVLVGDACELPVRAQSMDAIVFPYSVFQLLGSGSQRHRAMREASRVARVGARIWIDISQNFERRESAPRALVAAGWSPALRAEVREWETLVRREELLEINKEFEIDRRPGLAVTEHWWFASALGLEAIASDLPVRVEPVRHGYGESKSPHRRIHAYTRLPDRDGIGR